MGDCLGGYNFFDAEYKTNIDKPRFIDQGQITSQTLSNKDAKILEINSKSGLYPLYITYSIFRKKCEGYLEEELDEKKQNQLWNEVELQPKANIFVRGHCHYYQFCGDVNFVAFTMPALQSARTKYGARRCSGVVHFGLVEMTIHPDGTFDWQPHIVSLQNIKQETIKY